MKFLKSWTIQLDKLPAYSTFKKAYAVNLDYALLKSIYASDNPVYTEDRKQLLLPILNAMKDNKLTIKYNPRYGIGRRYPENSISPICISRHIKHTLFQHLGWVDIDMVKGHPTIIYEIAKLNSVNLPTFERYISNPSAIFKQLINHYTTTSVPITEDDAKDIFNIAIYGGGHSTWLNQMSEKYELSVTQPHPFVSDFIKECQTVADIIYASNPELVKKVKGELTDEYKIKSRAMSYWCGTIENHILYVTFNYLKKRGIFENDDVVLEYDGLCFKYSERNSEMLESLCAEINDAIVKETGLSIRMKWKGYKPEHIHLDGLNLNGYQPEKASEPVINVNSDKVAAELIFNKLKDILISYKGRIFLLDNNIWICDKEKINDFLILQFMNSGFKQVTAFGTFPYAENVSKCKSGVEALLIMIRLLNEDSKFYSKLHETSKDKLCFNDGVLDFKNKTFTEWCDVPPKTIYSCIKIRRDFKPYFDNPNHQVIEEIKSKVLEPMFGDKLDTALHFLSRAFAGRCDDKRWGSYLGNRNCGKGVIYDLVKTAGEDYVCPFELNNMLYCRKTEGQETVDASKKLYWLLDLEFCRLAISQEIPDHTSGLKLNGKTLKKLSGGNDEMVARRNYDRQDTCFNIDTTWFLLGNNSINCDSEDCYETNVAFSSVVQFKSLAEIEHMRNEGRSEYEMSRYRVADPTIKDWCRTIEWGDAFTYLLFESYRSYAVNVNCEIDSEEKSIVSSINSAFIIDVKKGNAIECKEVHAVLSSWDNKKIQLELSNMNVFKRKCKRAGPLRDKWCYFGLEQKKETEETDV